MKYRVFHRTWWKRNASWPNGLEPCAGRKTMITIVQTEDEARQACRNWNVENKPGKLSRKAEYERVA